MDVVGLGQNSVDHICLVDELPAVGSKIDARGYHLLPGGQVATAILTAHRLGLRACYIGALGDDGLGELACRVLREDGVRLELKIVAQATTQLAVILVDRHGERTIVEHYDPKTVVKAEDLDRHLITSARVLHLDITDIPAAIQAARWAREADTLVSMDIDRLLPGTDELLGLVDLLVASEGLSQQLGEPDPRLALLSLRKLCPGFVCITCGERGCLALDAADSKDSKDALEALWVPAFDVEVVDTTGCGDVFRGALIVGVLHGWDTHRALRYAAGAAALQAGTLGAQSRVPDREAVQRFLDGEPEVRGTGVETAGAETAGAETAGAETAGAETAGAETAGAESTR